MINYTAADIAHLSDNIDILRASMFFSKDKQENDKLADIAKATFNSLSDNEKSLLLYYYHWVLSMSANRQGISVLHHKITNNKETGTPISENWLDNWVIQHTNIANKTRDAAGKKARQQTVLKLKEMIEATTDWQFAGVMHYGALPEDKTNWVHCCAVGQKGQCNKALSKAYFAAGQVNGIPITLSFGCNCAAEFFGLPIDVLNNMASIADDIDNELIYALSYGRYSKKESNDALSLVLNIQENTDMQSNILQRVGKTAFELYLNFVKLGLYPPKRLSERMQKAYKNAVIQSVVHNTKIAGILDTLNKADSDTETGAKVFGVIENGEIIYPLTACDTYDALSVVLAEELVQPTTITLKHNVGSAYNNIANLKAEVEQLRAKLGLNKEISTAKVVYDHIIGKNKVVNTPVDAFILALFTGELRYLTLFLGLTQNDLGKTRYIEHIKHNIVNLVVEDFNNVTSKYSIKDLLDSKAKRAIITSDLFNVRDDSETNVDSSKRTAFKMLSKVAYTKVESTDSLLIRILNNIFKVSHGDHTLIQEYDDIQYISIILTETDIAAHKGLYPVALALNTEDENGNKILAIPDELLEAYKEGTDNTDNELGKVALYENKYKDIIDKVAVYAEKYYNILFTPKIANALINGDIKTLGNWSLDIYNTALMNVYQRGIALCTEIELLDALTNWLPSCVYLTEQWQIIRDIFKYSGIVARNSDYDEIMELTNTEFSWFNSVWYSALNNKDSIIDIKQLTKRKLLALCYLEYYDDIIRELQTIATMGNSHTMVAYLTNFEITPKLEDVMYVSNAIKGATGEIALDDRAILTEEQKSEIQRLSEIDTSILNSDIMNKDSDDETNEDKANTVADNYNKRNETHVDTSDWNNRKDRNSYMKISKSDISKPTRDFILAMPFAFTASNNTKYIYSADIMSYKKSADASSYYMTIRPIETELIDGKPSVETGKVTKFVRNIVVEQGNVYSFGFLFTEPSSVTHFSEGETAVRCIVLKEKSLYDAYNTIGLTGNDTIILDETVTQDYNNGEAIDLVLESIEDALIGQMMVDLDVDIAQLHISTNSDTDMVEKMPISTFADTMPIITTEKYTNNTNKAYALNWWTLDVATKWLNSVFTLTANGRVVKLTVKSLYKWFVTFIYPYNNKNILLKDMESDTEKSIQIAYTGNARIKQSSDIMLTRNENIKGDANDGVRLYGDILLYNNGKVQNMLKTNIKHIFRLAAIQGTLEVE